MQLAIQVRDVSKRYRISEHSSYYRTLRDVIVDSVKSPFQRAAAVLRGHSPANSGRSREFWALRDVSFDVRKGEVLGIIGRNGSGKSTLLKILSQITVPTAGTARVVGRVGSLLEVGTGFHFELSGRDNVFLNGAMLGMKRSEVKRKFDEIVEFSQIGDFLDTPVKHYSSGMYMRLAFAVAAHLQSEILLVDEVLAVGDFDFQKKCIAKMRELTRSGRTVLFVSHSMGSVEELCDRAMLLDHGRLQAIGAVDEIIERYMPKPTDGSSPNEIRQDLLHTPGNDYVTLQSVGTFNDDGLPQSEFNVDEPICVKIAFQNQMAGQSYNIRIRLRDQNGGWIMTGANEYASDGRPDPWTYRPCPVGLFESTCRIPGDLLNDQIYSVFVEIVPVGVGTLSQMVRSGGELSFRVVDKCRNDAADPARFLGPLRPRLNWQTNYRAAA